MKTKYIKLFLVSVFAISFILTNGVTVLASTAIDINKKGSVTMKLKEVESGDAISKAGVTIYKVADIKEQNNNISYIYTDNFLDFNEATDKLSDDNIGKKLSKYIKNNNIKGEELFSNIMGKIQFLNLSVGCYLVQQTKSVKGYTDFTPFTIFIPSESKEKLSYNIDASPKIIIDKKPVVPPETCDDDSDSAKHNHNNVDVDNGGGKTVLPQTGQLNWPVPLFFISGLVFIIIGILLYNYRRCKVDD